jgi:pimeloyl-ACP methyl ester carboxylesterase
LNEDGAEEPMPTMRVNGYDLSFVEQGTGVPLLLVHGTFGDYRYWAGDMAAFAARYRTIAISLRHCWPEAWDGEGDDYTTAQHVSDIAAFIAGLGAGPVHLLGLSLGGYIAFLVARDCPHAVRALVLVEPGGAVDATLAPATPSPAAPPSAVLADVAARIRQGERDGPLAPAVDGVCGPDFWARTSDLIRQITRDNARTVLGQIKEARVPISRADVAAIRAPTLLLAGEHSPAHFHRVLDGLQGALADGRRAVVPGAYHMSNIDNPDGFAQAVLAFLEGR